MRPPCALTGKSPASRRRAATDEAAGDRSMPHAETIEFPRKRYSTWTLRPLFEAIVSGWFPALLAKHPKMLRNSAISRVPPGRNDGPLPPGLQSLHGHATIGSRRKKRNKWTLQRCSEAIVARWFCRNPRNSLVIPAKGAAQEKNSRVGTLPGRKARENTDSRCSKPAKDAPIWGQNGGKREPRTRDGSK